MDSKERRPKSASDSRGPDAPGRRPYQKKKVCRFCSEPELTMDYKDAKALRPFVTEKGRIVPRRITGACAKHQRMVATAIKRARNVAIVPFTTTFIGG
ncbi:MAG: 30S ribosomal protein S18 [Deltaproteobacteria bacterium]|nr:30S ribosomal protein S18 [Deltaproteobacteria bacterium]